jgi:outer membrane protein assembly factor BamB
MVALFGVSCILHCPGSLHRVTLARAEAAWMIDAVTWPHFSRSLVLLSIVACLAPLARAGDWPQLLGPSRNGVTDEKVTTQFPANGPTIVWQRDVGAGFSGPVVAKERVYLFHRVKDQETLECMDAATGKSVWSQGYPTAYIDDFGFDEGPRATPTIDSGKVYTFGADGRLTCREIEAGKELWSIDTKREFKAEKGFFGMVCSPLVEGEEVVLNIGGRDGAGIVAFDRSTGKVLWKSTDDAASYSSPVATNLAGKRRIVALTRAGFVSLDPANGQVKSQFPWRSRSNASVNAAVPLVIGNRVFLSASYGTGAVLLDYAEPKPAAVWQSDDALSNHYATSIHRDGFLYGFHGRQEEGPLLRCVELNTGKARWTAGRFGAGTLMIAGDQLVVLSEGGKLMIAPASPDGFKPTATAQILKSECRPYPALADGMLFARSKDHLVCIDLRTRPAP